MIGTGPEAALVRYNIMFVLAHALATFGAYVLARQLGAGRIGSAVAGVSYTYAPWLLAQAGHLHVLSNGGIPLALAMLARGHGWSLRHGYRPERRRERLGLRRLAGGDLAAEPRLRHRPAVRVRPRRRGARERRRLVREADLLAGEATLRPATVRRRRDRWSDLRRGRRAAGHPVLQASPSCTRTPNGPSATIEAFSPPAERLRHRSGGVPRLGRVARGCPRAAALASGDDPAARLRALRAGRRRAVLLDLEGPPPPAAARRGAGGDDAVAGHRVLRRSLHLRAALLPPAGLGRHPYAGTADALGHAAARTARRRRGQRLRRAGPGDLGRGTDPLLAEPVAAPGHPGAAAAGHRRGHQHHAAPGGAAAAGRHAYRRRSVAGAAQRAGPRPAGDALVDDAVPEDRQRGQWLHPAPAGRRTPDHDGLPRPGQRRLPAHPRRTQRGGAARPDRRHAVGDQHRRAGRRAGRHPRGDRLGRRVPCSECPPVADPAGSRSGVCAGRLRTWRCRCLDLRG